jgi:hypothetical protein
MKYIIMAVALVCASVVFAAQDSALTIRNVRDPVQLRDKLNANALDAQTRVAALEVALTTNQTVVVTGSITAGSLSTTGTVGIAEGQLTDSTVVSADIKNGEIVNADINAAAAIVGSKLDLTSGTGAITTIGLITGGALTSTGAVTIAEGALANSTVLAADIKDGEIANADIATAAAIAMTKLATNSLGAVTLTFSSTLCTNVLYFSAQGILTNYTANP